MSIIVMIIAILVGAFENMKDSHDVQKWRNSGGMESRYNCWKKIKK